VDHRDAPARLVVTYAREQERDLAPAGCRRGQPIVTTLDVLGNFEFSELDSDQYAAEIDLPDGISVMELRVD
jgi:hypothetical protein